MKPFAGRAMIECNKCNTWIHLSCAKIRKSHVPETYVCQSCRESDGTPDARRSYRSRIGPRKHLLDWPPRPNPELWPLLLLLPLPPAGPTPFLKFRSCTLQYLSRFSINTLVDLSQALYPIWKQPECYFRFIKVCSCFPTDSVRKAITEWMSVCRWHF